jgi:hypothetical protein
MRSRVSTIVLLTGLAAHAQLEMPVRVVMNGTAEEQRQITGLADPASTDAAVSAGAARAGTVSFCHSTGTTTLSGDLFPPPTAYTVGMFVTLLPEQANHANATLDLNGLGERPIVKWGRLPLDSADISAGTPARLIYDGERFLLMNNTTRPCKTGYLTASAYTCVDTLIRSAVNFYEAVSTCHAAGARLCSMGEWMNACLSLPSFLPSLVAQEWVDDAANSASDAKVMGTGYNGSDPVNTFGCKYGSTTNPIAPNKYRCCHTR